MPGTLDVYRDWLGISETTRPLTHYQLLRVPKFEDDAGKIRANYRKMNAHVRKYGTGEFQSQSQELLNELAKAMLCLTDARRKAEYDASLGRADSGVGRRTLEQILIARKVVDQAALTKARNFSNAVGVEMRDALVQQKLAAADVVNQAYAESLGLPYLDLEDVPLDADLVARVPAVLARQHSFVPIMVDGGQLLMASPNPIDPEAEDELRLRLGMNAIRTVICTPARVNEAINKHYSKEAAVAQLAAGRGALPTSGTTAAPTGNAAGSAPAAKPAPAPSSPEAKKRRQMVAFMSFNFSFMGSMGIIYFLVQRVPNFYTAFPAALVIGGLIGAAVYKFLPD
jgi:hypothetical protein